jgi:hypothetical protein
VLDQFGEDLLEGAGEAGGADALCECSSEIDFQSFLYDIEVDFVGEPFALRVRLEQDVGSQGVMGEVWLNAASDCGAHSHILSTCETQH